MYLAHYRETLQSSHTQREHMAIDEFDGALAELGWKVSEYAAGKWEIGRPKLVVTFPKLRSNVPLHP